MSRTSPELVAGIVELDAAVSCLPHISIANMTVDDYCLGAGLSDARLEAIETQLAAHFYSLRVRQVSSESAGPVSETKDPVVLGKGLEQTVFGQTAMMLDSTGKLSAWNAAIVKGMAQAPSMTFLGSFVEDQYGNY